MTNHMETAVSAASASPYLDVDLESSHRVINGFMEALQRNFKEETRYSRPLMSPRGNIIFALDQDVAESMITYMCAKIADVGGFENSEFRFTRKCGANGEMLQRLRLEFPDGVNANVIRKLLIATDKLERVLPGYPPADA